jgi:hypothetical protein
MQYPIPNGLEDALVHSSKFTTISIVCEVFVAQMVLAMAKGAATGAPMPSWFKRSALLTTLPQLARYLPDPQLPEDILN